MLEKIIYYFYFICLFISFPNCKKNCHKNIDCIKCKTSVGEQLLKILIGVTCHCLKSMAEPSSFLCKVAGFFEASHWRHFLNPIAFRIFFLFCWYRYIKFFWFAQWIFMSTLETVVLYSTILCPKFEPSRFRMKKWTFHKPPCFSTGKSNGSFSGF